MKVQYYAVACHYTLTAVFGFAIAYWFFGEFLYAGLGSIAYLLITLICRTEWDGISQVLGWFKPRSFHSLKHMLGQSFLASVSSNLSASACFWLFQTAQVTGSARLGLLLLLIFVASAALAVGGAYVNSLRYHPSNEANHQT